jgi:hypothetical protein
MANRLELSHERRAFGPCSQRVADGYPGEGWAQVYQAVSEGDGS